MVLTLICAHFCKLNTGLGTKLDKSGGTISGGDLNVNGDDQGTRGLRIRRRSSDGESAMLAVDDGGLNITSTQDESSSSITFNLVFTDTEGNGGANAGWKTVILRASKAEGSRLIIEQIAADGIAFGGSAYAYVYGSNDDVYMRYKDGDGKAAHASAKTIMELIAAINSMLSTTTTTALTSVTANAAGALYSSVPSFYAVKNGWCFFHIWLRYTGNTGDWFPFYLPKPAVSSNFYFEDGYEHNGQLRIASNGSVRISNTKASTIASHYWGCYPTV